MIVKIKKTHPNAVIPKYAHNTDAGMDLTVTEMEYIDEHHIRYKFGIAVEIPEGYFGFIAPRSSIYKQKQVLSNGLGIVDSGYVGELMAVMIGTHEETIYRVGDRAAQLLILPYPRIEFEEVDELSATERGAGGYGSTGK